MSHRRALDRVLALVAGAECGEDLILRGSMTMLAWFGDRARPPADIDWVVRPIDYALVDHRDPYPHLPRMDDVRLWPEAAYGAGNYRMWEFEDFDTGGLKPRVPPEGMHWLRDIDDSDVGFSHPPHTQVQRLIEKNPRADDDVTFDSANIREDTTWGYDYGSIDGGARLIVPWRSADDEGKIQLDFAYDGAMPYRPGFAAVPRADGAPPTVAWSATREMSLVWKAQWLTTDLERDGEVDAKDVYDAVLLAEWAGLRFSPRLHRLLSKAIPDPHAVREWAVNGPLPSDSSEWTARLSAALERFAAQA